MFDFASYHRAATLADAINLLADNPQAKLLAGGTDVLIQLHHHNDRYRHIVDIHNLAELRGITLAEDGSLRIGSATTFTQLIEDSITQRHLPALCAAASSIAGPQIRNVAPTVEIFATVPPAQILPRQRSFMTRNWRSTPHAVFVSSRLMAFTPGRAKCLLSMTKSLSPFIFRPSRKNTWAARILNMPCATQWIFQRLAVPHIADWITAISANYAWHLVLPRQRRFAANMPNRLHKMRH